MYKLLIISKHTFNFEVNKSKRHNCRMLLKSDRQIVFRYYKIDLNLTKLSIAESDCLILTASKLGITYKCLKIIRYPANVL